MFAGPNGSGKSVLKSYLPVELLGVYLNPDEIEAGIKRSGFLDLGAFGVGSSAAEVLAVFAGSEFLKAQGLEESAGRLRFDGGRLEFEGVEANSYLAAAVVDFLRRKLMEAKKTFTFETVMSHPGKMALLAEAQRVGYRT